MAATGKYTRNWAADYCILDVETTGLSPQRDELLEIGLIRVRNNQIVEKYSQLVQPVGRIPADIVQKTGITEAMVANAPTPKEIQAEVLTFIGDDPILGHNTSFDLSFLEAAFGAELPNKYMDAVPVARKLYPDAPGHGLSDLTQYLGLVRNEHRALADCVASKALYDRILADLEKEGKQVKDLFSESKPWAGKHIDVTQIQQTTDDVDEKGFFFGQHVIFTGDLAKYSRKEAMQMVVDRGAVLDKSVTKQTTIVVLGGEQTGQKSGKQKKAEALMDKGQNIRIITESEFYAQL